MAYRKNGLPLSRSHSIDHMPYRSNTGGSGARGTPPSQGTSSSPIRVKGEDYEYAKLEPGYIRILELQPEPDDKELHGSIHVIPIPTHESKAGSGPGPASPSDKGLSTAPKAYQALSHFWGPEGNETTIKIITNNSTKEILIRPSLVPALKTLRRKIRPTEESTRFFWIDAICIDQKNPDDKSIQIPRMADIYSGAERVCVWLGEASPTSPLAIDFIERLRRLEGFDELLRDEAVAAQWLAFFELTWRPWFNRRWIVQEIAVAKKAELLCGDDTVPWEEFADAVSLFASSGEYIRQLFNRLEELGHHPDIVGEVGESGANRLVEATNAIIRKKDDGSVSEHMLSLEALISTLPGFAASDPHDDIFAILWLSKDGVPGRKEFALQHTKAINTPTGSPRSGSPVGVRNALPQDSVVPPSGDLHTEPRSQDRLQKSDSGLSANGTMEASFETPAPQPTTAREKERPLTEAQGALKPVQGSQAPKPSSDLVRGLIPQTTAKSQAVATKTHAAEPTQSQDAQNPISPLPSQADIGVQPSATHSTFSGLVDTSGVTHAESLISQPKVEEQFAKALARKLSSHSNAKSTEAGGSGDSNLGVPENRLTEQRTPSPSRTCPEVNYKKPIFEVCKDFLEFAMLGSKSLDIICFPWAPTQKAIEEWRKRKEKAEDIEIEREAKLPSWIQDKTAAPFSVTKMGPGGEGQVYRRVRADPLVGRPGAATRTYLACGKTRARWEIDGRSLIALGQVFGEVGKVDLPAQSGIIPASWLETVDWVDPKADLPDRFWRTLVADRGVDGRHPRSYYKLACRWAFEQRAEGGDLNTNDLLKHGKCNSIAKEFLRRTQAVVFQRHLITIGDDDNLIGLAPLHAREGDLVCILEGCSVPVLLRRAERTGTGKGKGKAPELHHGDRGRSRSESMKPRGPNLSLTNEQDETEDIGHHAGVGDIVQGNQYRLLGECYIHGMMSGEAWQYMEQRKRSREWFELV